MEIILLMSNNDEESWFYSKFCSLIGKKKDKTWKETITNMIKEEDESWVYALSKKGAKMGYRMISTPLNIATDVVEIGVNAYKQEKKQVAIGLVTLVSDVYTFGTAGAITKEVTEKTFHEVAKKALSEFAEEPVTDAKTLLFISQIFDEWK